MRFLTDGEIALARSIFGGAIDYPAVRMIEGKWWPFQPRCTAMAPMGNIYFHPDGGGWSEDFAAEPLPRQGFFIHELTHVWQAQQGVDLLTGKLKAGDTPSSYEYPVGMDCGWGDLNIEQQAMVVEHRFRLSRGQKTPGDQAFYDRVCPVGVKARNVGGQSRFP